MPDPHNPFQQSPSPNPYAGPPSPGYNPYAAPRADLGYSPTYSPGEFQILASRGSRFLGALTDGLIVLVFMMPPLFLFGGPEDEAGLVAMLAAGLVIMGIQWYLIATSGQSIAKRMLGMKIVKMDGSDVNFVSGVIMRMWLVRLLGAIPFIGGFIGLIDPLLIFGQERRCLHDYIAGTKVISV